MRFDTELRQELQAEDRPLRYDGASQLENHMAIFEISHARGWYEAECKGLGLKITARTQEEIAATARRAAARALGPSARVSLVAVNVEPGFLRRLVGLFVASRHEGHS